MRKVLLLILVIVAALWVQSLSAKPEGEAKDDPKVAKIKGLIHQADSLAKAYKLDRAIVIANIALEKASKEFSEPDTTIAAVLSALGKCYSRKGDYAQSESFWRAALDMRYGVLGSEHPDVGASMLNLGKVYKNQGRYAEAEELYKSATEIWEKTLGPNSPEVARSLNSLGIIYYRLCRYAEAEPLLKRALEIREKTLGPDHPEVARNLNSLGILYYLMGSYVEAEVSHRRALEVREKALGSDHPEVAASLTNLGLVYYEQGRYAQAEVSHKRAVEIVERTLGPSHPQLASSLGNLGLAYSEQGRYAEAEIAHKRALEIREKALGPDHPEVARHLNNLGVLYPHMGRYAEAESSHRRALEIREKTLGSDHRDVASSLGNLGALYYYVGRYARAEIAHKRALEIREKTLGPQHHEVAVHVFNLSMVYSHLGRYAEAELLCKRALEIRRKALGFNHPSVSKSLNSLAELHVCAGRYDDGKACYRRAQESRRNFINYSFSYASEVQKLRYVERFPLINGPFLSLVLIDNTLGSKEPALEMLLHGKGVVLEAVSKEKEVAYCSYDSVTVEKYEELNFVGGKIATMVLEGLGKLQPDEYRDSLRVLTERKETLEAELSQACSEFADALALRGIRVKDVAEALPKGSVLWEIVEYEPYDFKKIGSDKEKTGLPRYMAFQLSREGRIEVVDLGEAALIDSLVAAHRDNLSEAREAIYEGDEKGAEQGLSGITGQLYHLVFAPLEGHLKGNKRIFISPDGELNLLPYYILPCPDGKYLIEKYEISYLSSGRDLVKYLHPDETESGYALVMTNPDYNMGLNAQAEQLTDLKPVIGSPHSYGPVRGPSDRTECLSNPFHPLSATQKEGRIIADLIKENAQLETYHYYGAKASEEILKGIDIAPRVLHLATHGYFCPKANFSGGVKIFENPLLYSGLALSGANQIIIEETEGYLQAPRAEDGILTSLEVSGLNLVGTDLVVLSACQTGVGEVKNGEGVFGLRRSFQHAGAGSIVMSMWDIPDRETVELMDDFYREWLSGESKSRALRKSALKILSERRKSRGAAHPLFWGGFVLVGNPN